MIRGPGIEPNSTVSSLALNIDIAPTIADMAGQLHNTQQVFDGISLLPSLSKGRDVVEEVYSRDSFLVEYWGEGNCQKSFPTACSHIADGSMCECSPEWGCKCQVPSLQSSQ